MKLKQRQLVATLVAVSAFAATGCSNDAFSQVNKTITQITGATKKLGSARMPTAAIATALGGVELLKALSKDGQSAKSSGKIIAAGGGNAVGNTSSAGIIAAGGLNFSVLQTPEKGLVYDGVTVNSQKIEDSKKSNGVTGEIKYVTSIGEEGKLLTSTIQDFTGKTNGYDISAKGRFTYRVVDNAPGAVVADMTGTVKGANITLELKELHFETKDPFPTEDTQLGRFIISGQDDDKKIVLTTLINLKGGKIVAEAEVEVNGTKQPNKVKFDQDNPNFDGAAEQ